MPYYNVTYVVCPEADSPGEAAQAAARICSEQMEGGDSGYWNVALAEDQASSKPLREWCKHSAEYELDYAQSPPRARLYSAHQSTPVEPTPWYAE